MPKTSSFRDLEVWQEAMALVEDVYALTRGFPREEQYGLTSQVRRASISIPSNIGEGWRRRRRRAYLHHLDIALGSQGEVDVQVELAARLRYCTVADREHLHARIDKAGRMLNGLIAALQPKDAS